MTEAPQYRRGEERRKISDHISYFDSLVDAKPLEIPLGRSRCSNMDDVMLVTTVGSGIAICIHEPGIPAGGLGNLILPADAIDAFPSISLDASDIKSISEKVLGSMISTLTQLGGKPSKMRAKLFGGAELEDNHNDAGRKMYIFAKEYLLREGVQIASEDIGQSVGRRIQYLPVSGKGMRRLLKRETDLVELKEMEMRHLGA